MIAATLAATLALTIAWQWGRVRGTTLSAACLWAVVAATAFAAVEAALAIERPAVAERTASLLRYAAACGALCPGMAVLGAKRPQDRAWQWVVLSLWVVLMLPAGQLVAAGGGQLQLNGIWKAFFALIVIAIGPLNYARSRNFIPAAIFVAAVAVLLAPVWTPDGAVVQSGASWLPSVGAGLALVSAASAIAIWNRSAAASSASGRGSVPELEAQQKRWSWFSNAFGAFWELRVMLRVNQTAELAAWPVRLTHDGFVLVNSGDSTPPVEISDDDVSQVKRSLDSVLRRFERVDAEGL